MAGGLGEVWKLFSYGNRETLGQTGQRGSGRLTAEGHLKLHLLFRKLLYHMPGFLCGQILVDPGSCAESFVILQVVRSERRSSSDDMKSSLGKLKHDEYLKTHPQAKCTSARFLCGDSSMFSLLREDWEKCRPVLLRHYFSDVVSDDSPEDKKRLETQKVFINSYFNRFLRNGGETDDHFDLSRMRVDSYGIPQDLSKRYFVPVQRDFPKAGSSLSDVPQWLLRHFEYAVQLSMNFENECKLKKLRELRKSQRALPIAERKQEILDKLKEHNVLIIAGDTGCGKSTQVPQYLLGDGYTGIAVTQPRRLACTALAKRVAFETLNQYGSEVAYQIRFESTKSKRTKLVFLTEGLLIRQMGNDSLLQQYNVIILDEVHERHISSDLLIGLLRDLTTSRPDLRLILMSATINLELFTQYFPGAPTIQVPGRLYPIKLVYRPIKALMEVKEKKSSKIDPEPFLRVLELIDKEVPSSERGDALIFLNGVSEISTVAETLKTYAELNKNWIILMLHSTLSTEEQDRVFDVSPPGVRKCILSTNIAETSVTIDGIRFVIDSGKVNLMQYDACSGMERLSEFWVSKASADQRKGRAGRTGPGICYRIYSDEQYEKMDAFTVSEINRVSLEGMALQMLSLNLGLDVRTFPFIERPNEDALNEAMEMLKFQGVIHSDRESHLTALGNAVSKLPVAVPIGKMLVYGCALGCVDTSLTVAAGLSIQSPFTNRSFRDLDVIERRAKLCSQFGGDPFTLINIFREWVKQKCDNRSRRWCLEHGIDEHRMFEISKLRLQYRQILEDSGLVEKELDSAVSDSRQRRIDRGERVKLEGMKKQARNSERERKVLKADRHYDRILDEHETEELDNENDPMKADVKSVEFLLSYKHKAVDDILKSHQLGGRSRRTRALLVAVMAGLYPHYAILDKNNKYAHGQEMYGHTRLKTFCMLHPNGAIPQYAAESIDPDADSQGQSKAHQALFYGTLLETAKPYLCNVVAIPALLLCLIAKKVVSDDWNSLLVDDFVKMEFEYSREGEEVIQQLVDVRRLLARSVFWKLRSRECDQRSLVRAVDNLFERIMSEGVMISVRWELRAPRSLDDCGFRTVEGEQDEGEEEWEEKDEEVEDEWDERRREEDAIRQILRESSGVECPPTERELESAQEEDEISNKKVKKEETYYEKLLRLQKEREKPEEQT